VDSLLIDSEFRSLIPPLESSELAILEESILEEGVRDAIVTWNGYIVDGHNRYDIITKHGIKDYRVNDKTLAGKSREEVCIWIIDNQFGRRNISNFTRVELAVKREVYISKKARENINTPTGGRNLLTLPKSAKSIDTREELAKLAKVSHDTIWKGKQIIEKAPEELKEKLRRGEKTINQVYTTIHRQEVREKAKEAIWPTGKYRIIYADPPWGYSNNNLVDGRFGQQDDYYSTFTPEEIINKFPVGDIALDNSALFLWVTSPVLEQAFDVIRAWGFNYKASFVWDKVKHVMGHYNSVRHEFLLIAIKGNCQPDVMQLFDSVQSIERNGHSQKPDLFREIIDTIYPYGPRIELFATKKIDGWEVYGNQITA